MQSAKDLELDFLLEASQFLKWGYTARGDFGTLPPCRLKIDKRGQWVLAENLRRNNTTKGANKRSTDEQKFAIHSLT
jgi:hypothetical protein